MNQKMTLTLSSSDSDGEENGTYVDDRESS